jgi:hypothetical protein
VDKKECNGGVAKELWKGLKERRKKRKNSERVKSTSKKVSGI